MPISNAVPLAKETWAQFQKHNAQWLAAALAYFTTFAIAPLIIVLVEIAGIFMGGHQQALNHIFHYLKQDAGPGAGAVQTIVQATFNQKRSGTLTQIIGWVVFAIAAIGLFNALQFALNTVWDLKPERKGLWAAVCSRWSAFLAIMGVALMLFISILLNTGLTAMSAALTHVSPIFPTLMKIVDFVVSFGVLWVAFAFLFEYLPERQIEWRDVWVGGALTSFLFTVGQFLLGWYLGRAGLSSGYGAFGSLVIFLIWVNYSAQIMLFGAEFTHVFALRHGSQSGRVTKGEVGAGHPAARTRS